ncbi:MAG: STAS domain-containing protein [candidate division Zixibacteria bacterium]|nr:STAS domain-containing protein [candidate division Zixibacteria bacterium]
MVHAVFPFVTWLRGYSPSMLRADLLAGVTVALVLVPQSMAYAQLAGLPAHYGLYTAFLPPIVAALFGSSRHLATGPVVVVSLLTATALEPYAAMGSSAFIAYAITLTLMVGVIQLWFGLLRFGAIVNFLSHPVLNGFINAAAIIIATSQLSKLLGVTVDTTGHHLVTLYRVVEAAFAYVHWPTLGMAALALAIMLSLRRWLPRVPEVLVAVAITTTLSWLVGFSQEQTATIKNIHPPSMRESIREYNALVDTLSAKSDTNVTLEARIANAERRGLLPDTDILELRAERSFLDVAISKLKSEVQQRRRMLRRLQFARLETEREQYDYYLGSQFRTSAASDDKTWRLQVNTRPIDTTAIRFQAGGTVVGEIPPGLPSVAVPQLDWLSLTRLLPMALVIAIIGFMEAVSISKAIGVRSRQRIDPNRELIGQGVANLVGSFAQSSPVSGSFSRTAINLRMRAASGLASVFASGMVALTLLFFTPLLFHVPHAVLAAIVIMVIVGLISFRTIIHTWKAQWYDGAIGGITFISTLAFAPHLDRGIFIGVALTVLIHLFRGMRPNISFLSLHPEGSYRDSHTFNLTTCRHISLLRYEGSLIFANVNHLEEQIDRLIESQPDLRHIVIVGHGINELDASGEEALSVLIRRIREGGVDVSFTELNHSVRDVMHRTGLYDRVGTDHFYRNARHALENIWEPAHAGSTEDPCPLKAPVERHTERKG